MVDRLDIVIFGASGFTGMRCIPYMQKFARHNGRNFTWGIAGRSEEKLKRILVEFATKYNVDVSTIPVIICDIDDEFSLLNMTKRARLVINCVGPYLINGEKVVDACLKSGTHYIDVCGEPQFMEKIELTKHDVAKRQGVYVISACGVDSIPVDLGVAHLAKQFGELNSVVTYLEIWNEAARTGAFFNNATWSTLIHNVSRRKDLVHVRKQLFRTKIPELRPKLEKKNGPHRTDIFDGWAIPFRGADHSVVKRSQKYFYEIENKRPVQNDMFAIVRSTGVLMKAAVAEKMFSMLSKFQRGRELLLKYPRFFSFGVFSKDPPSDDVINKSWFQVIFRAEGWRDKRSQSGVFFSGPCDRKVIARIKGRNPGYGSTCICAVAAAIVVLSEKNKLPGSGQGGVYTPGVAFANTSLMQILNQNGMKFEVMSEQNILTSKL